MDLCFNAMNIDNSAIHIVIDQLAPFLKYVPSLEFRVLDDQDASEKHRVMYEQIFLPYCTEHREHFYCHHYDAPSDSWQGEQVCLSVIHTINQKAWWLLYYYAIKEAAEEHSKIPRKKIERYAHKATIYILDGEMSIRESINWCFSKEAGIEKNIEDTIVGEVTNKVLEYKKAPSYPMKYR